MPLSRCTSSVTYCQDAACEWTLAIYDARLVKLASPVGKAGLRSPAGGTACLTTPAAIRCRVYETEHSDGGGLAAYLRAALGSPVGGGA